MGGGEDMEHLRCLGLGLRAMLIVGVVVWSVTALLDWANGGATLG